MPKKFKGENTKAAQARERKEAQKQELFEKKQKAIDDAYWADDDKHVQRKQQRKEDKEKKRLDQLERKKELAMMADEEMDSLKGAKTKPQPTKVSRAEIEAHKERERELAAAAKEKEAKKTHTDMPLEENVNRLEADGEEARTVEDAISMLSVNEPQSDRHPEKRMKAAYQKFEDDNLSRLKEENPNMRLSQLKQIIKKDWMKAPENPLNQRFEAYNAKR